MRDIKFRGKRLDNGEWVYGCYTYSKKAERHLIWIQSEDNTEFWHTYPFEVYPSTVGQYTGLHDKNGREIYEGDICNCREYECFGKVEWNEDEAGFSFCVAYEGGGFEEERLYDYAYEFEVIGNIHENPELMQS